MKIDVVLITTGFRSGLLVQTVGSLGDNLSTDSDLGEIRIVADGWHPPIEHFTHIVNPNKVGASRSRNIGASSIPKYLRGDMVMFCDDDCYFTKHWDSPFTRLVEFLPSAILSGHAHPYNNSIRITTPTVVEWREPLLISTVHMLMPWSLWDDVGFFIEPGGSGGSEDYDYCMRAKTKGYGFAVTEPQCVIHTGLTSSSGKPIVGANEVRENNAKLEHIHGIEGKVIYQ